MRYAEAMLFSVKDLSVSVVFVVFIHSLLNSLPNDIYTVAKLSFLFLVVDYCTYHLPISLYTSPYLLTKRNTIQENIHSKHSLYSIVSRKTVTIGPYETTAVCIDGRDNFPKLLFPFSLSLYLFVCLFVCLLAWLYSIQ